MSLNHSEILRKNDAAYKRLKNSIDKLSEDEILKLIIDIPDLIQRPIVEKGNKAILARPPERIKEIL